MPTLDLGGTPRKAGRCGSHRLDPIPYPHPNPHHPCQLPSLRTFSFHPLLPSPPSFPPSTSTPNPYLHPAPPYPSSFLHPQPLKPRSIPHPHVHPSFISFCFSRHPNLLFLPDVYQTTRRTRRRQFWDDLIDEFKAKHKLLRLCYVYVQVGRVASSKRQVARMQHVTGSSHLISSHLISSHLNSSYRISSHLIPSHPIPSIGGL